MRGKQIVFTAIQNKLNAGMVAGADKNKLKIYDIDSKTMDCL